MPTIVLLPDPLGPRTTQRSCAPTHQSTGPRRSRPSLVTTTPESRRGGAVKAVQSARIDIALGFSVVALLILANGFFVAAELALIAVDRDRVDALAAAGSRPARLAANAMRRLSLTLSGTQLGVTVISLVLGLVAEPTVAKVLPRGVSDAVSALVALLFATVLQMVPALREEANARAAINVALILQQSGARALVAGREGLGFSEAEAIEVFRDSPGCPVALPLQLSRCFFIDGGQGRRLEHEVPDPVQPA